MSQFDWQDFLDARGIEYIDKGKSTAKNNIYVRCPFCGEGDQGHHMGISIEGRGWGCWRDQSHRGRRPNQLVKALLGCSMAEAEKITGSTVKVPLSIGFFGAIKSALNMQDAVEEAAQSDVELLPSFRPFRIRKASPHLNYMRQRGFSDAEIEELAQRFNLHTVMVGSRHWSWRIIIPVYNRKGKLMTWTGRAVGKAGLRYQTLSDNPAKNEPGEPTALGPITNYFLNMKQVAKGGRFLILSEGPFDCMRLALHSDVFGGTATCFFGKAISPAQVEKLAKLRKKYEQVFLLLDAAEKASTMRMASNLSALKVKPFYLEGNKDPGEMTAYEVSRLLARMSDKVAGL